MADVRGTLPLQQLAFHLDALGPDNEFIRVRCSWRLDGPLDAKALVRALRALVDRHEAFRMRFLTVDGAIVQTVAPPGPDAISVEEIDLSSVPAAAREAKLLDVTGALAARRIDLANGPLFCAQLVHMGDHHVLYLVISHSVFDGGSVRPLFAELQRGYRAMTEGVPWPLHDKDYGAAVDHFLEQRTTRAGKGREAYWLEQLRGAEPVKLPVDLPRDGYDGRRDASPVGLAVTRVGEAMAAIPAELREAVGKLAKELRASPYHVLLAVFVSHLRTLTGQDDICFQSTFTLRATPGFDNVLGFMGNALVIRIKAADQPTLRDLVQRVRNVAATAWANTDGFSIHHAPHGVRRINFNYVPAFTTPSDFAPGITSTLRSTPSQTAQVQIPFDLHLWLVEGASGMQLRMLYSVELFHHASAQRLLDGFVAYLDANAPR